MSQVTNALGQKVEFDMKRAKKAEKAFVEWIYQNPRDTCDISDVAFSVWGYGAALHEIDAQAAQIKELVANDDLMANCNSLRNRCWKAGAQIEALKDLLIDDRCKCIMLVEKLKLVANDPKWMEKGMEKTLDEYMQEARQQLNAEMPGVVWE